MDQELSRQIWAGDPAAIATSRRLFEADPEGYLMDHAVALYSFRGRQDCVGEFLQLRPLLIENARRTLGITNPRLSAWELAVKIDVLTTHLEWMSRRRELTEREQSDLRKLVIDLCAKGVDYARSARSGDHTRALLRLTYASALFVEGLQFSAVEALKQVESEVVGITDRKQRARVMRKTGMLYRRHVRFWHGLGWGWRAVTLPGIPRSVRVKNLVAILPPRLTAFFGVEL
jgi:hypothetical protein